MPYMLLIVEPPGQRATRTEAEGRAGCERMLRFGEDLQARECPAAERATVEVRALAPCYEDSQA